MKKFLLSSIICLLCSSAFGQIQVIQFNAGWNKANDVEWIKNLSDCEVDYVDVAAKPDIQQKNAVVVVPTIIIFQDGKEIKRYQADLSFKMVATKKEVQDYIDEIIFSDF